MPFKRDAFLRSLFLLSLALGLLGLGFVLLAYMRRPDNPVEAELVFEALRVARGRPLYVDPSIGAWEDGGPPSRFFVLYTPVWPWLLGHLAGPSIESIRNVGRAIATGAWLLLFVVPVIAAKPLRRSHATIAALLGLGIYFIARNAPSATPDTLAVLISCVALVRVARRGEVDALSAALFTIAPLVKPSCLGVLAGVALAHAVRKEPGRFRAVGAAVSAGALVALFCSMASEGAWLTHIVRSTGQPLTWTRLVQELGSRALVLGLPHVVVAVLAIRRRAPLVLTAPLVASIVWSSFAMAKHGSGTQYWIEPTMAAIVAVAFMPARRVEVTAGAYDRLALRCAVAMMTVLVAVTSLAGYASELEAWRAHDTDLADVNRYCARGPGDVVVSSEASLELALDGRILVPDWQSSFLARRGAFPAMAWRADLRDPHVRWLVLPFDPEQPAPDTNDARIEVSAFRDLLRSTVEEQFALETKIGGLFVFRRRDSFPTGGSSMARK